VVNALAFLLVGWISDKLGLPFEGPGSWSAFWGRESWWPSSAFILQPDHPGQPGRDDPSLA